MFDELKDVVKRDYDVFSGIALEGYFRARFMEGHVSSRMGGWWDRKGENEIDLVCENEFSKSIDFYEVKRDAARIDLRTLERKSQSFFEKNPERLSYRIAFKGLSIEDM